MTPTYTPAPPIRQRSSSPTAPTDQQKIAAIEAAITTGAATFAIVTAVLPLLYGSGITAAGLNAALTVANSVPVATSVVALNVPTAQRGVLQAEPSYRAAYIFNAARRISAALAGTERTYDQGDDARRNRVEIFRQAMVAEQHYWNLHKQAQANRVKAAKLVDAMSKRAPNGVLRWKAVLDSRTTTDCRGMDGQTFTVDDPPSIGFWPGAVHPQCRCRAVPA